MNELTFLILLTKTIASRMKIRQLSSLLAALRAQLYRLADWQAPIKYADQAASQGLLRDILAHLSRLDYVFVRTDNGEALRVVVVQQDLTEEEAAEIEEHYRDELVHELRMHDFRGIVQIRQSIRLPLADIYLELGLLNLSGDEEERRRVHERLLAMDQAEQMDKEERRLQDRVPDALVRSQRLVILGEPGSGRVAFCSPGRNPGDRLSFLKRLFNFSLVY